MKLIKRTGVVFLVLVLAFSSVAYARSDKANENNGRGNSKNKVYTKLFEDVEENSWANSYIEKMALKKMIVGDGRGRFNPNATTKYIEAIIMTIRTMGWEDEAKEATSLPENYTGAKIPNWAVGYFAYAVEKGLIKENEFDSFSPNAAAKRYHVAKYIVRALGKEDEALAFEGVLDFKDVNGLTQEDLGYIKVISDLELMVGYNGRFKPHEKLSRAEMATLFARLDDKVDTEEDNIVIGLFNKVEDGVIFIEEEGSINEYNLADNLLILDETNTSISIDTLEVGVQVKLVIVEEEVVTIEVSVEEIEKIVILVTGRVKEIVIANEVTTEVSTEEETTTEETTEETTEATDETAEETIEEIEASETQELENELNELKAQLEEKNEELEVKKEELSQLIGEKKGKGKGNNKDLNKDLIEELEDMIEDLEDEIEDIEERIEDLEEKIEELIEEVNDEEEEDEEDEEEKDEEEIVYSTIKIQVVNRVFRFKILEDVKIASDGNVITLADINVDDTVKLTLNENKYVTEIEILKTVVIEEETEEEGTTVEETEEVSEEETQEDTTEEDTVE